MGLFSPKKKKVVRAVEKVGATERTIYDYVDVSAYEREREGDREYVGPYRQRREVRAEDPKPSFLSLRRRKKKPEPSFLERGGESADQHADLLER